MIPMYKDRESLTNGFPRVSGDDPSLDRWVKRGQKFSPRERG